jgi:CO dehydrogenase nickel-insertion accessory protein CooC1
MSTELVLLCIIMALYIGWKASQAWHLIAFRKIMQELKVTDDQLVKVARDAGIDVEELTEETAEESDLPILEVRVEQQPEGLFAYRKADNLFLAMGKDRQALMDNLVNNLSNVRVVVAKEDGAELITP